MKREYLYSPTPFGFITPQTADLAPLIINNDFIASGLFAYNPTIYPLYIRYGSNNIPDASSYDFILLTGQSLNIPASTNMFAFQFQFPVPEVLSSPKAVIILYRDEIIPSFSSNIALPAVPSNFLSVPDTFIIDTTGPYDESHQIIAPENDVIRVWKTYAFNSTASISSSEFTGSIEDFDGNVLFEHLFVISTNLYTMNIPIPADVGLNYRVVRQSGDSDGFLFRIYNLFEIYRL